MAKGPETRPSLLIRLKDANDAADWNAFLEIYEPLIFSFCKRRGLQDNDASDVTQDVLQTVVRAIKKLEYDRTRGLFRNWLFRVVRSKLVDHIRRVTKQVQGSGQTGVHEIIAQTPVEELEHEWDREAEIRLFEWACEQVRPQVAIATWRAFWMSAVEQKPSSEVAKATGLSVGGVYTAKSRVVARIRTMIHEASNLE